MAAGPAAAASCSRIRRRDKLRVAVLASVPFDLGDGHLCTPIRGPSVAGLIELERLDPGHDDFRGFNPDKARSWGWQVQAVSTALRRAQAST